MLRSGSQNCTRCVAGVPSAPFHSPTSFGTRFHQLEMVVFQSCR